MNNNKKFAIVGDFKDRMIKRLLFMSKNLIITKNYLTPKVRLVFSQLKEMVNKVSIFQYLNPKYHILIENKVSSYTIIQVLSELTLNYLN